MAEAESPPPFAPPRPETLLQARLARLMLLLAEAPSQPRRKPADIERLGIYDFFADNPMLLFGPGSDERRTLMLAGFDPDSLSYHSSSQRFTNRRSRMQHDLSHLLARDLVTATADGSHVVYALTDRGRELTARFNSSYADGYRTSARLVTRELNRRSATALRALVQELLEAKPFIIDLYAEPADSASSGFMEEPE
jgi:hypothetical protein